MEHLSEAVAKLVDTFGQSAPHLWAQYVAFKRADNLASLILFLILTALAAKLATKLPWSKACKDDPALTAIGMGCRIFFGAVCSLALAYVLGGNVAAIFYPEGYAVSGMLAK